MLPPEFSIISEEIAESIRDDTGIGGKGSDLISLKELNVPFLLSGNNVMNEHGALGGDGFVDGGAASLSDDEVMG